MRAASVVRAQHRGQSVACDRVAASFIAEDRTPAAGATLVAALVATECHRSGSRDDHDPAAEADRAGESDARIDIDHEVAARKERFQRIDDTFVMLGMIRAGDTAV